MQCFLGALPVRHFLFQLGRAFVHAPLQILAGVAQLGVALLNLLQHLVESVDQDADFILRMLPRADGIIPGAGNHLRGPGQLQDRIRDRALQAPGHRIRSEGNDRDDQCEKKQVADQELFVFDRVPFQKHGAHFLTLKINCLEDQDAVGGKPAGFVFHRWRGILSFDRAAVINGEGLAVMVVNDGGQDVRLGRQGAQDVLARNWGP